MLGRALTCIACINHNQNIKENSDERQLPVKDNEQYKRANHLNKRQNKVGKAVVERFRNSIHVICKETHDIAAGTAVKEPQRQRFNVLKKVSSDVKNNPLSSANHNLRVTNTSKRSDCIHNRCEHNKVGKATYISPAHCRNNRLNHIGAQKRR